jgi:hypothetical protein
VIAVFGDQDMSEKSWTGEALGDRTLRDGRLMDGPAGPAAIARPADADDSKPRGHMIEHLADGLTDHMQFFENPAFIRFAEPSSMTLARARNNGASRPRGGISQVT